MNRQECDILEVLLNENFVNQRILSELSGYSLGSVNKSLKNLKDNNYLTNDLKLSEKAIEEIKKLSPKNAIILAADKGIRTTSIDKNKPKALIEVNGEILIERIIRQLNEVNIREIYIVVGFMKEQFEYLIDKYKVKLIVNNEYNSKNNIYSLFLASKYLSNTYIIPCDIWCRKNPFDTVETYSWYMVADTKDNDSKVKVNRKKELSYSSKNKSGNKMIGIAYLNYKQSYILKELIEKFINSSKYDKLFWENIFYDSESIKFQANICKEDDFVEINSYEELKEFEDTFEYSKHNILSYISKALNVQINEISELSVIKKGMTNRSFLFLCRSKKYILRIPGKGTDKFIKRREEFDVYKTIQGKDISDEIIYINPNDGYKISEFIENARVCDPNNENDLKKCMEKLKKFHELKLKVKHRFDIFEQIEYYESLLGEKKSVFRDYEDTKRNVFSLKNYIENCECEEVLCHIDSVSDNFIFNSDGEVKLIDWEYAGMQDPHIDIAMFCIYSLYDKEQIDNVIDMYFEGTCDEKTRVKIYFYIASCGLIWSNWCEYKIGLGTEFGEYALMQYRYAKEYYKIVKDYLDKDTK